jgi:hypothetical protein
VKNQLLLIAISLFSVTVSAQKKKPIVLTSQQKCELVLELPSSYTPNFSNGLVLDFSNAQKSKVPNTLGRIFVPKGTADSCLTMALNEVLENYFFDEKRRFVLVEGSRINEALTFTERFQEWVKGGVFFGELNDTHRDSTGWLSFFDIPVIAEAKPNSHFTDVLAFHEAIWEERENVFAQETFTWVDSLARLDVSDVLLSDKDQAERFNFIIAPLKASPGKSIKLESDGFTIPFALVELSDMQGKIVHLDSIPFVESVGLLTVPKVKNKGYYQLNIQGPEMMYSKRIYIDLP